MELGFREPGRLQAYAAPPIRVTQELSARRLLEPKPGVYVFDLGQNFAGWARLRVRGPAGTAVTMRYGELLHDDATLNVLTTSAGQIKLGRVKAGPGATATAPQSDTYVLSGNGEETYTPRFTFHGLRYVEVTGLSEPPDHDTITGVVLHSTMAPSAEFSTSNPLVNCPGLLSAIAGFEALNLRSQQY